MEGMSDGAESWWTFAWLQPSHPLFTDYFLCSFGVLHPVLSCGVILERENKGMSSNCLSSQVTQSL